MGTIDNLVVINGGEGMADLLGQAMTMGGAGFGLAKQLINAIGSTGQPGQPVGVAAPASPQAAVANGAPRSEERRVGKERRCRGSPAESIDRKRRGDRNGRGKQA